MRLHRQLFAASLIAAAWGAPLAAHPSSSLVMDGSGNVYYSDLKRVWRLSPDGNKSVVVEGVHTHELYLDAAGALYGEHLWYEGEATDRWGHRVWRLDPDGSLHDVYPAREGFRSDHSFVRDAAGNHYWAATAASGERSSIRAKSAFGAVTTLVDRPLGRVGWMAVDDSGALFFTAGGDRRHATSELYRRSPDGRLDRLAGGLAGRRGARFWRRSFHDVYGIWPDQAGGAYVAVLGERRVKHVDARGRIEVAARSFPPWSPTGGLRAKDGALWILESGLGYAMRVRRLAPDGGERVY